MTARELGRHSRPILEWDEVNIDDDTMPSEMVEAQPVTPKVESQPESKGLWGAVSNVLKRRVS